MAQFDIYNIEERLQQIDPKIIRIDFDHKKGRHKVIAWDEFDKEEYTAWTIPAGQLDARTEADAYRINPERYNAFDEMRKIEAEQERRSDQKCTDMATDLAENIMSSFRHSVRRSID